MCRLLMMSGITDPESAIQFMRYAKEPMSIDNNMGIGYTATKRNGEFFTERWHNNDQFMKRDVVITEEIMKQLKPFEKRLPSSVGVNYSLQGTPEFSPMTSITMHTRYATCGREFMNTHPFVDGDFSLVHNGVISNSTDLKLNKISTCDSEVALQAYKNLGINLDPSKAQEWLDMLEGYWAFGIFSRDSQGRRILDIVRNSASLYATTVEGLGIVLATTSDIITSSAKKAGLEISGTPNLMTANKMFRLDAATGNVLEQFELKDSKLNSRRSTYYGSDYSNIFGTSGTTSNKSSVSSSGWSGNSSSEEDDYPTKRNTGKGAVLTMPAYKSKAEGNEVKEPEISMENNGLDFYEDEFQQLDDSGIPMLERIRMFDQLMDSEVEHMLFALPMTFIPDFSDESDFYDVVDQIEEAYTAYTGKLYKM